MVMINTPLQVQNSSERIAFGLTIIKMVSFFCGLERSNKEYKEFKEYKTNALNVQISDNTIVLYSLNSLLLLVLLKKNLKKKSHFYVINCYDLTSNG